MNVTGKHFLPLEEIVCFFDDLSVRAVYISPTFVQCKAPALGELGSSYDGMNINHAPASIEVSLNGKLQDKSSNGVRFWYYPDPVIDGFAPHRAVHDKQSEIIVFGTNFPEPMHEEYFLCNFGAALTPLEHSFPAQRFPAPPQFCQKRTY